MARAREKVEDDGMASLSCPSCRAGELITIKYTFTDTSNASGSCTFTVKPDLTFTGI